MSDKQQAIFMGFLLGLFFLAFRFYVVTSSAVKAHENLKASEMAKFRIWAEKACANGFTSAEFIQVDHYQVVCR